MHIDSLPPHKAFWGLGITVFLPIRPNFIVRVRRTSSWYTKMFCLSFPFSWLSPLSLSVESGAEAGCAVTASESPMWGAALHGLCSVGPSNALLRFFFSSWEGHGVVISSAAHESGREHMSVSRAKERALLDGPAPPLGLPQLPCTPEVSWWPECSYSLSLLSAFDSFRLWSLKLENRKDQLNRSVLAKALAG